MVYSLTNLASTYRDRTHTFAASIHSCIRPTLDLAGRTDAEHLLRERVFEIAWRHDRFARPDIVQQVAPKCYEQSSEKLLELCCSLHARRSESLQLYGTAQLLETDKDRSDPEPRDLTTSGDSPTVSHEVLSF